MTGYARIWSDMLGYWDMMGYVGICLDMQGYGGICEGGGLHVLRSPCTCYPKAFCLPPMVSTFD
jgi:hypothetical protein